MLVAKELLRARESYGIIDVRRVLVDVIRVPLGEVVIVRDGDMRGLNQITLGTKWCPD